MDFSHHLSPNLTIVACILYGFPCEMDFSHHKSPNPTESLATRVGFGDPSGEISISHGKPYKMHFLVYFTRQDTLVMQNTLCKVEDHANHARWIYLTTVLYMYIWERQKYARSASEEALLLHRLMGL